MTNEAWGYVCVLSPSERRGYQYQFHPIIKAKLDLPSIGSNRDLHG